MRRMALSSCRLFQVRCLRSFPSSRRGTPIPEAARRRVPDGSQSLTMRSSTGEHLHDQNALSHLLKRILVRHHQHDQSLVADIHAAGGGRHRVQFQAESHPDSKTVREQVSAHHTSSFLNDGSKSTVKMHTKTYHTSEIALSPNFEMFQAGSLHAESGYFNNGPSIGLPFVVRI